VDRRREGIGYGLLVVLGWSFPGVFVRLMPSLAWHEATAIRLGVAMAATLPIVLMRRGDLVRAVALPSVWVLACIMAAYYATATAAFGNAPVGEVALLIASAPAWAALYHYANGHRDRLNELYGALVAIVGVAVVSLPSLTSHSVARGNHALGIGLGLSAAVCAAAYSTGVGRLHARGQNPGSLPLVWLTFLVGTLSLGGWTFAHTVSALADYWPLALGLGVFSTALPTVAYAAASERLPRGITTMFNPAVVVPANLAAAVAIREMPSWWMLPGSVLVLVGTVVALRASTGIDQA
jgi:drug/metabolite transporter (DMT)-like permease